jgi:Type IV pili methyl-accepting chemotaxis transducer N-term
MQNCRIGYLEFIMDRRLFIAGGVASSIFPFAQAQSQVLSSAINRTARCRMLSQRAVKAYGLVALKLNTENTKPVLARTIKEMRETVAEVDSYNRGRSFASSRAEFSAQLLPFLNELANEPSAGKLLAVSVQSDKVLDSANAMVVVLESFAGSSTSKLINMAGRQRMLTQRIAKNYVLQEAKVDGGSAKTAIENDKNLFLESHKQLSAAPISTPTIKESLEKGLALFIGYIGAIAQTNNIESISRISEGILVELDNQTLLYEKALASVVG